MKNGILSFSLPSLGLQDWMPPNQWDTDAHISQPSGADGTPHLVEHCQENAIQELGKHKEQLRVSVTNMA